MGPKLKRICLFALAGDFGMCQQYGSKLVHYGVGLKYF